METATIKKQEIPAMETATIKKQEIHFDQHVYELYLKKWGTADSSKESNSA